MPHHLPTHRLAEKIRVAKVAKERSLQLQEKAQIRVQQAEYNTAFNTYVKRGKGGNEGKKRGAGAGGLVHAVTLQLWYTPCLIPLLNRPPLPLPRSLKYVEQVDAAAPAPPRP